MKTFLAAPAPTAAVDIGPGRISAVSLTARGGKAVVAAHATETLPEGAVMPSLNAANILDRRAVGEALARVFERLGSRPRRVGLVMPDSAAKVSLIRFEQVPARPQDLDQLVRAMVRKSAPFRIEDAQVSFAPGAAQPGGGREFIVALSRRDIVAEYEGACAAAGAHAGLVDLASFNIINALLASGLPAGDALLVHATAGYTTLAIIRGGDLIFYRNRTADEEGSLADLVHQTAMYYEDRLSGAGFGRVVLAGAAAHMSAADTESFRRSLEERLGTIVESVDPRGAAALTDRITAAPALLDTLAPLVGLLVREIAA